MNNQLYSISVGDFTDCPFPHYFVRVSRVIIVVKVLLRLICSILWEFQAFTGMLPILMVF